MENVLFPVYINIDSRLALPGQQPSTRVVEEQTRSNSLSLFPTLGTLLQAEWSNACQYNARSRQKASVHCSI